MTRRISISTTGVGALTGQIACKIVYSVPHGKCRPDLVASCKTAIHKFLADACHFCAVVSSSRKSLHPDSHQSFCVLAFTTVSKIRLRCSTVHTARPFYLRLIYCFSDRRETMEGEPQIESELFELSMPTVPTDGAVSFRKHFDFDNCH